MNFHSKMSLSSTAVHVARITSISSSVEKSVFQTLLPSRISLGTPLHHRSYHICLSVVKTSPSEHFSLLACLSIAFILFQPNQHAILSQFYPPKLLLPSYDQTLPQLPLTALNPCSSHKFLALFSFFLALQILVLT